MASKASTRAAKKANRVAQPPAATVSVESSRLWVWLFAAATIVAGMAYSPALNGPFIFDDYHLPFSNPNADNMPIAFWIGGVRPILMASYWINYQVSGTKTPSYHFLNLLLHAATAVVVFFLLQRLLKLARIQGSIFLVSLFGAALFLLHPLQTESVAYVAGRSELISGFFLLGAWLVFLKHFENETKLGTAVIILLLAGAAVLGKESAISLPAVLLLTDWYWNPAGLREQIRSRLKLYLPIMIGGLVAGIAIIHSLSRSNAVLSVKGVTPFRYALTECRVILTYFRLFLIPIGQNGDWQIPFYRNLADHGAWLYAFGILILLGGIVLTYRRARLLSFGLAVFLALLMPTSSVVPINDALAERRMYVPIVGLILAGVAIAQCFRLDSAMSRAAAIVVLIVAATLTSQRSRVWGSDIAFWENVIEGSPGNSRAHLGLGDSYLFHGRYADALKEFEAVERLDGASEKTILNRVLVYEYNHNYDLALDALHKVAAMHPTAYVYTHIGYAEASFGRVNESLSAFNLALNLDPTYVPAFVERGNLYATIGDDDRAAADFQSALKLQPNNQAAIAGLGSLAEKH
jgi:Tfp pilus assembly protein PilF